MEVGEGNLLVEAATGDEGKEPLKRDRVVAEVHPVIREVDPQEFEHEALALELAVAPPLLARPPLSEPDELREVLRIDLLPAADEVQVLPDAGAELGPVILADKAADIVGSPS